MAAEAFFNSDYFSPLDRSEKGKQAREEHQRLQKELQQQQDDSTTIFPSSSSSTTASSHKNSNDNNDDDDDDDDDDAASLRTTTTAATTTSRPSLARRTPSMPTTVGRGGVGNWVPPEIQMGDGASVSSMASTRRGPAPRPVSSVVVAAAAATTRYGGRGGAGNYLLPVKTAAEKEAELKAAEEERRGREKDIELEVMRGLAEPVKAHLRAEEGEEEE